MQTKSWIHLFTGTVLLFAAAHDLRAGLVSFGFSGTISSTINPSNTLPADITVGKPFTGVFTYDTTDVMLGGDTDPDPEFGDYYFRESGGFWLQVNVAGHILATVQPGVGDPFADITIHDGIGQESEFSADASAPTIRLDGGPVPGSYTTLGFSLYFYDNSGTAYTNDALPTAPLALAAFPATHRFELDANSGASRLFDVIGTITNITTPFEPRLSIRRDGSTNAVIAWPLAAAGFTLQSSTNPASGNWQPVPTPVLDVVAEHTVTVPSGTNCFYRLKK